MASTDLDALNVPDIADGQNNRARRLKSAGRDFQLA